MVSAKRAKEMTGKVIRERTIDELEKLYTNNIKPAIKDGEHECEVNSSFVHEETWYALEEEWGYTVESSWQANKRISWEDPNECERDGQMIVNGEICRDTKEY